MLNNVSGVQCADSVGRRQNVKPQESAKKSGLSRLSLGDKCFLICWTMPSKTSPVILGMSLLNIPRMPLTNNFTTAPPCRPWIAQEFISHCHRNFPRTLEPHQLRLNVFWRSFWIFLINFTLWKTFYSCLHVLSHGLKFPSCREDILRFCLFFGETKAMQKFRFCHSEISNNRRLKEFLETSEEREGKVKCQSRNKQ